MTVLVSDSFNRADSTTGLGTTDSYNGGSAKTWQVFGSGVYGISTNQAYITANTNDCPAYVDVGLSDVSISVDMISISGIYTNGLSFRVQDANNFFRVYAHTGLIKIERRIAGSYTTILNQSGLTGYSTPFRVKIVLSGSNITVYYNNTQIATVTDTNLQTVTKHGLYLSGSGQRVDNFEIDDLNTGGTNASVIGIAATSSSSSIAPTVTIQQQISVSSVVANATIDSFAPNISTSSSVSANISSVVSNVNASAINPVITARKQVSITSTVANANSNAIAPTFSSNANVNITGIIATSIANVINPTINTIRNVNVTSIVGTSSASALSPQVGSFTNVTVNAVIANANGSANNPSVTVIKNASLIVPTSNTSAMAFVPNVGSSMSTSIASVIASLVVDAIAPNVSTSKGSNIQSVVANVNSNTTNPTIQTDMIISAIISSIQASGMAPFLNRSDYQQIIKYSLYIQRMLEFNSTIKKSTNTTLNI